MKTFFTNVPLQVKGKLDRYVYAPVGNDRLGMSESTSFPILAAVNGYVEAGEEFRIIAVCPDSEDGRRNMDALRGETEAICQRNNICCHSLVSVPGAKSERVSDQVAVFQRLIDYVEEDDELFACITFGTKPQSQVLLMALQYAYRVKRNTSICCVVYGQVDRSAGREPESWKAYIYDETALLQLDEIVRILAERKVPDPKAAIISILGL